MSGNIYKDVQWKVVSPKRKEQHKNGRPILPFLWRKQSYSKARESLPWIDLNLY